jgi:hypothetical protein
MIKMNNQDRLIDKAAKIWAEAMKSPRHDNGDNSEQGEFGSALMAINTANDLSRIDNIEGRISIFEKNLSDTLKEKHKSEGERFRAWLDVDYNPCKILADCAETAGLPQSIFSIKSSVSIMGNCVCARFSYAGQPVYYYPMSEGRWLKARLLGEDILEIIKALEADESPKFEITD